MPKNFHNLDFILNILGFNLVYKIFINNEYFILVVRVKFLNTTEGE